MEKEPLNIPTLHESLYKDYKAGKLTLEECAMEFHKCGWDNFVDVKRTAKRLAEFERIYQQTNH